MRTMAAFWEGEERHTTTELQRDDSSASCLVISLSAANGEGVGDFFLFVCVCVCVWLELGAREVVHVCGCGSVWEQVHRNVARCRA